MRCSCLAEASCPSWCWSAASHGHWSLPRSCVVQMSRHRLYFSPSIAGLDALAISQPKSEKRGLQLALSAFPMEYGLRTTGPSFSILAAERSITFLWLFLFSSETAVQLPGVELQHRLTLTREIGDAGTQCVDGHTPPTWAKTTASQTEKSGNLPRRGTGLLRAPWLQPLGFMQKKKKKKSD